MQTNLPKPAKKLYSIGEAALLLRVSVDTIRRWEKAGKIHVFRTPGKTRMVPGAEIERINQKETKKFLSVGEAAKDLGVSIQTLRRWDRQGLIKSIRGLSGERQFNIESIQKITDVKPDKHDNNSLYGPKLPNPKLEEYTYRTPWYLEYDEARLNTQQNRPSIPDKPHQKISHYIKYILIPPLNPQAGKIFPRIQFYFSQAAFILSTAIVIIFVLNIYPSPTPSPKSPQPSKVLGVQEAKNSGILHTGEKDLKNALYPFSRVSLGLLNILKPEVTNLADPLGTTNLNRAFVYDEESRLQLKTPQRFRSSDLIVDDEGLVEKLNADLVDGHHVGTESAQILALDKDGNINIGGGAEFGQDVVVHGTVKADKFEGPGLSSSPTTSFDLPQDLVYTSGSYSNPSWITSISGGKITNEITSATIPWSQVTSKPNILSSVDGVSNNEGNINLVAGTGITVTPDDFNNTITFTIPGGGTNADLLDSVDSTQFLRSDTSDSFTAGTLTTNPGTTLDINGTLAWGGSTVSENLNMNDQLILNIGNAGTDFTAAGGLTLADDLTISGGDITGAAGAALDLGEANPGDITTTGDLIVADDSFFGLSNSKGRLVFDDTPSPDEIDIQSATLDMNNNIISNIGAAGTDFTATGGLNLSDGLVISNGGLSPDITTSNNEHLTITADGSGDIVFQLDNNTQYQTSVTISADVGASFFNFLMFDDAPSSIGTLYLAQYQNQDDGGVATGTPDAIVNLLNDDTNEAVADGLLINSAAGGITDAVDASDPDIINAIDVGQNTILGSGSFNIDLNNAADTTLTIENTNAGNANLVIEGTCTSEGVDCAFDIAEIYNASEDVEPGELLVIDQNNPKMVRLSYSPYQQTLIGIVSTNPALVFEEGKIHLGVASAESGQPRKPLVALAGRVPVKVSSENGPINAGDLLTSSSQPGIAMKADKPGYVVGKALESFTGPGFGKISVFVNSHYSMPENSPQLRTDEKGNAVAQIRESTRFIWQNSAGKALSWISDTGEAFFGVINATAAKVGHLIIRDELAIKKDARISGKATIDPGKSEVFIKSEKVNQDSLVNLTPTSRTKGITIYIKQVVPGEGFTAVLEKHNDIYELIGREPVPHPVSADPIEFNWLVINQE